MARTSLGKQAAGDLAVLRTPRRLHTASPGRCRLSEASLTMMKRQAGPEGISRLRLPKGLPTGQSCSSSTATSTLLPSSASSSSVPSSRSMSSSGAASEAGSVKLPEISSARRAPEAPQPQHKIGGAPTQHRRFTASELDLQLEELIRRDGRAPTVGVLTPGAAGRAGLRDRDEEENGLTEWEALMVEEASRFAQMRQIQAQLEESTWKQTSGQAAAKVRADQDRVEEKIRRLSLLTGELGGRTTERRRTWQK